MIAARCSNHSRRRLWQVSGTDLAQEPKKTAVVGPSAAPESLARLRALNAELCENVGIASDPKFANDPSTHYNLGVSAEDGLESVAKEIRDTLSKHLLAAGDERLVAELCAIFKKHSNSDAQQGAEAWQEVHEPTGTVFPLKPRHKWADRNLLPNPTDDPEAFLDRIWSDLLRASLLSSETLRRLDGGLYTKLRRRAEELNEDLDEYFLRLGVLTKKYLRNPPADRKEGADFLRGLVLRSKATSLKAASATLAARSRTPSS